MLEQRASRLLLWACRLGGLAPLTFSDINSGTRGWEPRSRRVSLLWKLYSLVILCALVGFCTWKLVLVDAEVANNKTFFSSFIQATSIVVAVTAILVQAISVGHWRAQRTVLVLLTSTERLVCSMTPERWRFAFWWIVAQLASWLALTICYVVVRAFQVEILPIQSEDTLRVICSSSLYLTFMQFGNLAQMLYLQMASVNERLRKLLKLPDEEASTEILGEWIRQSPDADISHLREPSLGIENEVKVLESVRDIRALHHRVREVAGAVQSAYGMQMLLLLLRNFVATTTTLYITLARGKPEVLPLIATVFNVTALYLVLTAGQFLKEEAKQTAEIVQLALVHHQMSIEIQRELRDFSLNLLRLPTELSAGGLLPLDHSIVQGFVGSITTYLVIMLQFAPSGDMLSPSSNSTNITEQSNSCDGPTTPRSN